MMMQQGVLAHAVDRRPAASDIAIIETPRPVCPEDGVLIRLAAISLDPYVAMRLRGRHMGEPAPRPMLDAIPGHGVGQVAQSRSAHFREGDWVHTTEAGWRDFAALPDSAVRKIDMTGLDPADHLGALGMPGLTAWAAMRHRADIRAGDIVLIDAAAGAVGGAAGQIARALGAAYVAGIAGGAQKCALVQETYRFDACIDYRSEGWQEALQTTLPDGLDVHLENVSTAILQLALSRMRPYGRAVLCGLAGEYHADGPRHGIPPGLLIAKRASLMGLVVYDYYDRWAEFTQFAAPLVRAGMLKIAEDSVAGWVDAPALFERMVEGRHVGKAMVRL
ncbi:MAG: zinc-binding dehydrogenase [Caulobacterales bacterium]|uniref:zinc-binding dehydrogenase n=1 Tax=Glycocaulis sp. TaxID=1969725 RepID=UPI003F9F909F